MRFSITIQLYVKFRAFGITFGNVRNAWIVQVSDVDGLHVAETSLDATRLGTVLIDARGVFLSVYRRE